MDGNHRYARVRGLQVREGHERGFANAANIIFALRCLGVPAISFFMFGVDNFKRDPTEIADIMDIIKTQVGEWVRPGGIAHKLQVRVRLCGEREFLDPELLEVLDYAMESTEHYTGGTVNLCIAYGGRREIVHGIRSTIYNKTPAPLAYSITQVTDGDEPDNSTEQTGTIPPATITYCPEMARKLFSYRLHTQGDPPPDIIVRTLGETRLSDYMLCNAVRIITCTSLRAIGRRFGFGT
ncbi:hypothetical protein SI65_08464 [Aspergillus cristatus]|uniref:Alkyl transferase n=1 Tax=Aspergillus cristatus TaxID=573508 RepID=A0A1E3B4Y6_ASPCR|nr:hypothetical protein SI65_08464 [Aspergillus cristatus]